MVEEKRDYKERAKSFAKALFELDREMAAALVSSLENKTQLGYIVSPGARWTRGTNQRAEKIVLRKDGFVVASFSETEVYPGGFLSPISYEAAMYLKECRTKKKSP